MATVNVVQHVHQTDEDGTPFYDQSTEPWTPVYGHFTTHEGIAKEDLFPDGDDNLHWSAIPKPEVLSDDFNLAHVEYDGDQTVNAYWQSYRPVDEA